MGAGPFDGGSNSRRGPADTCAMDEQLDVARDLLVAAAICAAAGAVPTRPIGW